MPVEAWSTAEQLAHRLTAALPGLKAAASLAGVIDVEKGEVMIASTVDTTGLHRRRVWEGWRCMAGRTGRWGALLAVLGAGCADWACESSIAFANMAPHDGID